MTTKPDDLQRLLAEEPFVRALAHSLVADEADDVVQQAFLQALQHRPGDLQQPRSWLARIVRNLVVDHRRRHARADSRHLAAAPRDQVPSSSELLEGEERRRALVAAVDGLPADQRTVVLLRYYDGLPPRRIAAQLTVPVATVSNRLHAALQTLRSRLDADHGDRRAWLLPLVPFATSPRALPWREVALTSGTPALVTGVIAMTTKTKIVAAVAALLMLALAWVAWPNDGPPQTRSPTADAANASIATADMPSAPSEVESAAPRREAVVPVGKPTTGTGELLVHMRYADEPTAAAGLTVAVVTRGGDFRVGVHRTVTDAAGTARFEALAPGTFRAKANRMGGGVTAEIRGGETSECTLQLRGGMTLTGIVLDDAGAPIGGALVEAGMAAVSGTDAELATITAADGTFTIRACHIYCVVGARAAGHAASHLHFVRGEPGGTEHVRIPLTEPGGTVEGVVSSADGSPVPNALVRVGKGRTDAILTTPQGAEPLPAQGFTDADGHFVAVGIPVGTAPLQVRGPGFAPWSGTCDVAAGLTARVRVSLSAGVTCIGVVRTDAGEPAPDVAVTLGTYGDFLQFRTRTAQDGSFTLTGLPVGESELLAAAEKLGKAKARVRGEAGATVRCELALSNGLALRGRVADDAGTPIVRAEIRCEAEGDGARWTNGTFSDKEGRFVVADCPPGRGLTVRITAPEHVTLHKTGVDPRSGEQALVLARDLAPKSRITGRLLRPDGSPAAGETVELFRQESLSGPQRNLDGEVQSDGSFTIEARAGEWHGRIQAKHHPEIRIESHTLAAGEPWDLGTLQLTTGGTLLVRDAGEGQLHYLVFNAHEHFVCGLYTPVPPLRSELLAPGDYVLLARKDGIAAQALPFTIRSEQETELAVTRPAGVRQTVEFVPATGGERPRSVGFQVRRDGKLVLIDSTPSDTTGPLARELWLTPGSYTLATRNRQPPSTASFTVGSTESPTVRVTLR